jgi:hypothetical protein
MASVIPGTWTLTKSTFPSGEKVGQVNSWAGQGKR